MPLGLVSILVCSKLWGESCNNVVLEKKADGSAAKTRGMKRSGRWDCEVLPGQWRRGARQKAQAQSSSGPQGGAPKSTPPRLPLSAFIRLSSRMLLSRSLDVSRKNFPSMLGSWWVWCRQRELVESWLLVMTGYLLLYKIIYIFSLDIIMKTNGRT